MRKICLLIFSCLYSSLSLQSQQILYSDLSIVTDRPCPGDPSEIVTQPLGWLMYQTTDGQWYGPIDTNQCISVTPFGNGIRINLGQLNPNEPLFLRATQEELANAAPFNPDWVYSARACGSFSDLNIELEGGANCPGNLCSGIHIGIGIPDENGNPGGGVRWQTGNSDNSFLCATGIETCFPTEYFTNQKLQAAILQYKFPSGASLAGKYMDLYFTSIEGDWTPPDLIQKVDAYPAQFNNGQYYVNVAEASDFGWWGANYLLRYTAPTYPDAAHPSYVEGQPIPNSSSPQIINLTVDLFQNLEIQPFTYLRGALVENSDSVRHQLNLLNNGGDLCFNFVDLVFAAGNEYRHAGGHLDMNNAFSCMQFRRESALRVMEGAVMHYGNDGVGMLALCAGSTLAIERSASLVFDGVLNLSECSDNTEAQQIYMDLPPGSRLVFTEKAHVTNQFSVNQEMRLNVRMLGGELDDWALPAEDRARIRRIYPEPSADVASDVRLAPNPFAGATRLQYVAAAETEMIALAWISISGQIVSTEQLVARRGLNEWQLAGPDAAGAYVLHLRTPRGTVQKRVLRMR